MIGRLAYLAYRETQMKTRKRQPLALEALESRWVPATIRFDGSNLFVHNPLITGGSATLTVNQKADGSFQVLDGAANNGSFRVTGNITLIGNNAADTVNVNVSPMGLVGNLSVAAGNGANSVTIDGTAAGAFIAGDTRVNVGNSPIRNDVFIGSGTGLTNRGSVSVTAHGTGANNLVFIGGGANPSKVLGNTQLTNFPTVILGVTPGDTFAGNVNVQNQSNPQIATILSFAPILGNFTVQGGAADTSVEVDGNVLGQAVFNLGNGTNSVLIGGNATPAVTLGSLTYNAGNGANTFLTSSFGQPSAVTIFGNAAFNWGNGFNAFNNTNGLTVNGNLSLTNGNGRLDVAGSTFQAQVFGNLNVNTGNGNNFFTFDGTNGASVGGSFFYTGGNGGNNVTVNNAPPATNLIQLFVRFGNNPGTGAAATSNVFTIGAGTVPGTLTGFVSFGVPSLTANGNAFNDNGYVFANDITFINLPS